MQIGIGHRRIPELSDACKFSYSVTNGGIVIPSPVASPPTTPTSGCGADVEADIEQMLSLPCPCPMVPPDSKIERRIPPDYLLKLSFQSYRSQYHVSITF